MIIITEHFRKNMNINNMIYILSGLLKKDFPFQYEIFKELK